jgi:hypothetical protein
MDIEPEGLGDDTEPEVSWHMSRPRATSFRLFVPEQYVGFRIAAVVICDTREY